VETAADIATAPNATNGIKKPSLIRVNKIATIDRSLVDQTVLAELNIKLKALFPFP